jgi:hypothetical protein
MDARARIRADNALITTFLGIPLNTALYTADLRYFRAVCGIFVRKMARIAGNGENTGNRVGCD